jgi:hypothetical protein
MQKLVYIFLLWAFVPVMTFAGSIKRAEGPIIVGNGAGEGEYSVLFVKANLKDILEECANVRCQLTAQEQSTLAGLRNAVPRVSQVLFKSSKEMPGKIFELHANSSRADVWVNQDLLWEDAKKSVAFTVGDAAELWIHILAAVSGGETPSVQSLGEKLKAALATDTQRGGLTIPSSQGSAAADMTVEYLLWSHNSADVLVIRDPQLGTLELTKSIAGAIHCAEPTVPRIFSPAWLPLATTGARVRLTLQFGIAWTCQGRSYTTHGLSFVELLADRKSAVFDAATLYSFIDQGAFRAH